MEKAFLYLTPKRFLCPYCGKWHNWSANSYNKNLGYYTEGYPHISECDHGDYNGRERVTVFYFEDGYCYFKTLPTCGRAYMDISDRIPIRDIVESIDEPKVTFTVRFYPGSPIGSKYCTQICNKSCQLPKLADESYHSGIDIKFGFEFEQSDYDKVVKSTKSVCKKHETQKKQTTKIKEDATMANILNINSEFGPNKDENIVSTLMGIAVKSGDSWRIYDKKKKEITDVGDMQLGNLPIFILPTTKLKEGDLIKDGGEYYFVMKVEKGSTQTLCAKTGEMKTVIPIKNVLGFSCYSKVIDLSDSVNIGDDFDVEKLAIMSSMCGQFGEDSGQMNQLFPLMLFKDKLGGDDDMMKMMLMSSMMNTSTEDSNQNATMNQLMPLMLLKDKDGSDDDMKKMLLMSSMMSGNMSGNNNPFMSYLMIDMLMDKKKEEQPSQHSNKNKDARPSQRSNKKKDTQTPQNSDKNKEEQLPQNPDK